MYDINIAVYKVMDKIRGYLSFRVPARTHAFVSRSPTSGRLDIRQSLVGSYMCQTHTNSAYLFVLYSVTTINRRDAGNVSGSVAIWRGVHKQVSDSLVSPKKSQGATNSRYGAISIIVT